MSNTDPNQYQDGDVLRVMYEGMFNRNFGNPVIEVHSEDGKLFGISLEHAVDIDLVRPAIVDGGIYQQPATGRLYVARRDKEGDFGCMILRSFDGSLSFNTSEIHGLRRVKIVPYTES